MADTTDELTEADEAFAGNRLLSTFSREARGLIEPFSETVRLKAGDVVLSRGDQIEATSIVRPPASSTDIEIMVGPTGNRLAST